MTCDLSGFASEFAEHGVAILPGLLSPDDLAPALDGIADIYPTIARIVGADMPSDRIIDGVDQLDFFTGKQATSNRDGFVFYIKSEMRAVKWRSPGRAGPSSSGFPSSIHFGSPPSNTATSSCPK